MTIGPRLAVRALILHEDRLLLVNAWKTAVSDLWCAPGGGVEPHSSLHDNLVREVFEETGWIVDVGDPVLVNEFHDPDGDFHQVEIFFRCTLSMTKFCGGHSPDRIVSRKEFFSRAEMAQIRFKPDSLPAAAWGAGILYDPLEPILR